MNSNWSTSKVVLRYIIESQILNLPATKSVHNRWTTELVLYMYRKVSITQPSESFRKFESPSTRKEDFGCISVKTYTLRGSWKWIYRQPWVSAKSSSFRKMCVKDSVECAEALIPFAIWDNRPFDRATLFELLPFFPHATGDSSFNLWQDLHPPSK